MRVTGRDHAVDVALERHLVVRERQDLLHVAVRVRLRPVLPDILLRTLQTCLLVAGDPIGDVGRIAAIGRAVRTVRFEVRYPERIRRAGAGRIVRFLKPVRPRFQTAAPALVAHRRPDGERVSVVVEVDACVLRRTVRVHPTIVQEQGGVDLDGLRERHERHLQMRRRILIAEQNTDELVRRVSERGDLAIRRHRARVVERVRVRRGCTRCCSARRVRAGSRGRHRECP